MTLFRPRCGAMLSTVFDGRGAPNSKPLTIMVRPHAASVSRNGYHEADTFTMDFDLRELPFDPDMIASMSCRVYMWDSDGDESKQWAIPSFEMIRGLCDEPEMSTEEMTLTLPGRDYTAVLDPEWDPKKKIPSGKPLDVTIQEIADAAAPPGTSARFLVDWQAVDDDGWPIQPPTCGGLRRSTKKKGLWVKPGKTYWEVIYELALSHGFIAYVRDSTIIINTARTQTQESLARAPVLVYGKHLTDLRVRRKLAREVVPTIKIAAWDPVQKKQIEVTYPSSKHDVVTALKVERDQIERIPAPKGVTDRDTLWRYARLRHELLARAESTYILKTRFLSIPREISLPEHPDIRGYAGASDLLRLQAGDPIGIGFDPFNGENFRRLSPSQRIEHLAAMGYSDSVAAFVAFNYERLEQFRQPYYVRTVTYDYSDEDGLEIEIEAVNYASEARERRFAEPA